MDKFETGMVQQNIKMYGVPFEFKRNKINKYKEQTNELYVVCKANGIFHSQQSFNTITDADTGAIVSLKGNTPMILVEKNEMTKVIQQGDIVKVNSILCKVVIKNNYLEKGYAYDIICEAMTNE